MQNWRDNLQTHVPGYRDRVAHVGVRDEEGGLNLDMPGTRITELARRGQGAAAELSRRFAAPVPGDVLTWENHRWIRYRTLLCLLQEALAGVARAFDEPMSDDKPLEELLRRGASDPPNSYRWRNSAHAEAALQATRLLLDVGRLKSDGISLCEGAPSPRPSLRVAPRV